MKSNWAFFVTVLEDWRNKKISNIQFQTLNKSVATNVTPLNGGNGSVRQGCVASCIRMLKICESEFHQPTVNPTVPT